MCNRAIRRTLAHAGDILPPERRLLVRAGVKRSLSDVRAKELGGAGVPLQARRKRLWIRRREPDARSSLH